MRPAALSFVLVSGAIFGFGLAFSSMVQPEVVLGFLLWQDMGLLLVLGGAVAVTFLAYHLAPRLLRTPWLASEFGKHPSELNARTLGGAAIFGVGWGLSGLCPGPAIASLCTGNWKVAIALGFMLLGAYAQGRFFPAR